MTAREVTSHLDVPQTPTAPGHAASKKYVDDQIAGVVSGSVSMDSIDGLIPALNAKMDKSLVDAKGDILIGTADNTPGRLAVGTNGQVLKANSGATNGLEWGNLDKAAVGLANVDNTSDAAKPISTAQAAGLQARFMTGTSPTAQTTVAKTVSLDSPWTSITPAAGDWLLIRYTNGAVASGMTLAVNGGTARAVRGPDGSTSNLAIRVGTNQAMLYYFDGTYFQQMGASRNDTYAAITQAQIVNAADTTATLITGQRAEDLMANEATKTRTLQNKTINGANNTLVVPQSQVTNLTADLGNKADAAPTASGDVLNKQTLQTHPEAGVFSNITHTLNDLSFNDLRGGSVTYSLNGAPTVPGSMGPNAPFRNNVEFAGILIGAANDVVVIEVTTHKAFRYTCWCGIVMSTNWAARDVTMEVYDTNAGVWRQIYQALGAVNEGIHQANAAGQVPGGNDITKIRYTLTNFATPGQTFRITSLFLINYASGLLTEGFLPRDGGAIYGPITTPTNPATADALARKGYVDTKEPAIAAGTTDKFWRGDKTWQTIPIPTRASLGIENVDNTSDINKPVSTAQAAAISTAVTNERTAARTLTNATIRYNENTLIDIPAAYEENLFRTSLYTVSPESRDFTHIPHFFNDVAYNLERGGTVTVTKNGSIPVVQDFSNFFSPDVASVNLGVTDPATDVWVIEINLCRGFDWVAWFGIAQHPNYRARDIKLERFNVTSNAWTTVFDVQNQGTGVTKWQDSGWGGSDAVTKLRYTLKNLVTTDFRITNLFALAYDSQLLSSGFVPKGGGELYGPLSYGQSPTSPEHLANKDYVDDAIALAAPERTWAPEMVINSGALADGYNDMPGGISVEPGPNANGVFLDSVWVRLGSIGSTVGTGSALFSVYVGTKNTQGTLVSSVTLPVGSQDQVAVLGTPYSCAANAVVRVYVTVGTAVITGPVHFQCRGRYKG
ncbi:hypothetical protein MYRNA_112 [Mycobacterium phage Myrna]|uniref:Uncharacterized protein n=1 Tax=Mycobacterium phage Myrna TaxID=546805 RepID=B5LJB6_9CAUD|nr:gp112 [Mycobacterium phage Myrna]ACH62113.1 hypothetical protein MYRNA_112 [Mycobacterium phage Myrna]